MQRSMAGTLIVCVILVALAFIGGRCTHKEKDCAPVDEALLRSMDSLEFELDSVRRSFAVTLIENGQLEDRLKNQPIKYKYITKVETDSRMEHELDLVRDSLYKERSEVQKRIAEIKQRQSYDSLSMAQIIDDAVRLRERYDSLDRLYNTSQYASLFDKWIDANFVFTPPSKLGIEATLYDEITLVHKEERSGLFGMRKTYFVDAYNANPYVTDLEVKSFKIVEKPKRFGIGPYIGGGINNQGTISGQLGVGLHYSLIKF
jgi:hypothetical protein